MPSPDAHGNRDQIVAAALVLFRDKGLDVSMKEVADRAGVGAGTLNLTQARPSPNSSHVSRNKPTPMAHSARTSPPPISRADDPCRSTSAPTRIALRQYIAASPCSWMGCGCAIPECADSRPSAIFIPRSFQKYLT
ncbi:TetR family transcriptional regulator [Nocardia sp. NBC_00881]|uniref:TetR/AcrR family transcriptional regulator n=1 Tax=Nocardia sp. NBC_00881 TaxID=2975995 RepID=UPI003868FE38